MVVFPNKLDLVLHMRKAHVINGNDHEHGTPYNNIVFNQLDFPQGLMPFTIKTHTTLGCV